MGSLSGGISARSEKLLLDELATGSDIIGSLATRGDCCTGSGSIITAADSSGPCAAWDSGALTSKSPMRRAPEFESEFPPKVESKLESKFPREEPPAPPPVAAAAAALLSAAGGWVCECTGASILGGTVLGETGRAEGSGLTAPDAAETNLLAAAARAAELTATFGVCAVFLGSVVAFLPLSLHFSRSSTSSRAF